MISENSIIDALAKRQEEREKQQETAIENEAEYRIALNRIFAMNEGKLFAKIMFRHIGLFTDTLQLNPAGLIEEKGRKSHYLKYIRPYLEKEIRQEIENL